MATSKNANVFSKFPYLIAARPLSCAASQILLASSAPSF